MSLVPRPESMPFCQRRRQLMTLLGDTPLLVQAGSAPSRNYPANSYEFRASSHFLYLVGQGIPAAALLLSDGEATLFVEPHGDDDALWHGPMPGLADYHLATGVTEVRPLRDLRAIVERLGEVARLPLPASPSAIDEDAAEAIIALRLTHDAAAVAELRRAAAVTQEAHLCGMLATQPGQRVSAVRAAMEGPILAADFTTAYPSIVTVHGEVLHCHQRRGLCQAGDLLLADVGAEADSGWASDVTRTWPVSGRFSPTQRACYEIVLAAQEAAIAQVRPGVRYRSVHLAAARVIAAGLRDEGILRGDVDGLVERGAHALFFPHGVGHLLGLDVHDMEDLGDRAGYEKGRTRSRQFGLCYLRLDRDLLPGMAVTIEPGLYLVPSILDNEELAGPFKDALDRSKLARFRDVRGIRIEDDVLVGASGAEVLTAAIPKKIVDIEAVLQA